MIEVNLDDVKALHRGLKKYDKKTQTVIRAYGKSTANTLQNTAKRSIYPKVLQARFHKFLFDVFSIFITHYQHSMICARS